MSRHTLVTIYRPLEDRIRRNDLDAWLARWEFGRALLEERGNFGRLPHRRLEQLANALARSRAELKNRLQFAEQYPTEARARWAFERYGSWFEICRRGLGQRGRPRPWRVDEDYEGLRDRVENFLLPGRLEYTWLRVIPSLNRIEAEVLRDVFLDLRRRVEEAVAQLDHRIAAEIEEALERERQQRAQAIEQALADEPHYAETTEDAPS